MQRKHTFRQQQFFLLMITLSILAVAILMLNHRENVQRDLAARIDDHRIIVYHVDRARDELRDLRQYLLARQLQPRETGEAFDTVDGLWSFANSVSMHVLREHVRDLLSHKQAAGSYGPLSAKLERQMDGLLTIADGLNQGEAIDLDRLRRQIEGLILSMQQIEGVHALDIRSLGERQAAVLQREGIALIFMITMLVLASYLAIAWITGRIRNMVEEQDVLTSKLEQKNAELERFAYTVSHDLKSPLVTIKNFVGMLERDLDENDRRKAYQDIEHISAAADDMASLLEGLLELSRLGHIVQAPQVGHLGDVVGRAVDQLRPLIELRGVEMRVEPNMPDYWGDGLRLQEVFQNLVENSIKFMGDQSHPVIRIGAHVEHDELVCSVEDNGIGIDAKYADRIFNLFERLDPSTEGTGIGLALVQRIVEAHGGRVWIDPDKRGPGCRICFSLPLPPREDSG